MTARRRSAFLSSVISLFSHAVFFIVICVFSVSMTPLCATAAEGMDLVFLLDVSGSMVRTDPDYLLKDAVVRCTGSLPYGENRVAVVPFSDRLGQEYPLAVFHGQEEDAFLTYMKDLTYTRGDTDIGKALARAVEILTEHGENSLFRDRRIILVTDGVIDLPHTGNETAAEKESLTLALLTAEKARDEGILIDTAGLGDAGRTDENLLGYLADRTGGTFAGTVQGSSLGDTLSAMVEQKRTFETEETEETEEEDTEDRIIPAVEDTEESIWQDTEPYTDTDDYLFYPETEKEPETETEGGRSEEGMESDYDRKGLPEKGLPVPLSGILIAVMAAFFGGVLFFRNSDSSGNHRFPRQDDLSGARGQGRRGGILRFYVKMDNQKIFGVPTQNMAELPGTGKIRLSELVDDPYLESARTDKVLLRITKNGPVLQSRTDECMISDGQGNTKKTLNLYDGCRFRVFCATDAGTAVIVAVYLTGKYRESRSMPQEEEKTRLLV